MRWTVWSAKPARLLAALLGPLALLLALAGVARADAVVGNGTPGSCTNAAFAAAVASGGAVTFNCGPAPTTITVTTQIIQASQVVTIDGGGLITLSGQGTLQHFLVLNDGTLALANLTLTQGSFSGGGAIFVRPKGIARLYNVTVTAGEADGGGNDGGAIINQGSLEVAYSQFEANHADDGGGAIYNDGGTAIIRGSEFSNNFAQRGGALFNDGGAMTLDEVLLVDNAAAPVGPLAGGAIYAVAGVITATNSTLTGNIADTGGAIYAAGTGLVRLVNVTVYANRADTGGGLWNAGSMPGPNLITVNTIIAGSRNRANTAAVAECGGLPFPSAGHNLVGDNTCLAAPLVSDQMATDPKLGGLANNGGSLRTLLPQPGSPAINTGSDAVCPPADARSYFRPILVCDMGAVEAGNELLLPLISRPQPDAANGR